MIFGLSPDSYYWLLGRLIAAYFVGYGIGFLLLQLKKQTNHAFKGFQG